MRRLFAAIVGVLALGAGVVVSSASVEPDVGHVSVRAGEGLWSVAARLCPHDVAGEFAVLQTANPWYVLGLHPGTVLHRPDGSCPPPPPPPPTTMVSVTPGYPTPESTGPRVAPSTVVGSVTSSVAGQLIQGITINGRLTIAHDDVLVRDVVVMGTGMYMIHVERKANGECPSNVRIEYVEVDGRNAPAAAVAVYGGSCGYVFDRGYVHNVGRGFTLGRDTTVSDSYVYADRTWEGAHRNAVLSNGGSNLTIRGNALFCEGSGCSSALSLYGDFSPIDNVLVEGNVMSTTGHYCIYGGSVSGKPYQGSNVRIVGNRWSTLLGANCGRTATVTGHGSGQRGNVRCGNSWLETGVATDAVC